MKTGFVLLSTAGLSLAFPGLIPSVPPDGGLPAESLVPKEKRQLGGLIPSLGSLLNDVSGLLGSVASSVDPNNYRPEPGYEFQAPGPGDSRGPCPGLNLLANHGYLPRNGYVNFGQVVDATA